MWNVECKLDFDVGGNRGLSLSTRRCELHCLRMIPLAGALRGARFEEHRQ
jgi:hypothetical protein